MTTFFEIEPLRDYVKREKKVDKTIGFVPTMGALHEGHFHLIHLAKQRTDAVVVSVYVNPEQFGPNEDFEEYPRQLQEDLKKCEEAGVAAVFAPGDDIMYPDKNYLRIEVDELNRYMDGGSRPGFFEGIMLIVNKLFNIIEPDVAVFGQKDIQQFQILSRMVVEFNHKIELVMGPIVRADDGLALSSRNAYLSKRERELAPSLYRSLLYLKKQIEDGAQNVGLMLNHQKAELEAKGFKIDYLNVFSTDVMAPIEKLQPNVRYILAGAVYLGETRLIDNMILQL